MILKIKITINAVFFGRILFFIVPLRQHKLFPFAFGNLRNSIQAKEENSPFPNR